MKICFVLPRTEKKIYGGYNIVYEYANRLTELGNEVYILYLNSNYLKRYKVPRFVKKLYFDRLNSVEPRWYYLSSKVNKVSDYNKKITQYLFEESDVVIATAVKTAQYVSATFKTKNKLYFIQGRENWAVSDECVDSTYCLGMKNIVVSKWLKDIVDEVANNSSYLIPNPIDLRKYGVINSIDNRPNHSIACLYNPNPCKGFDNAFRVLLKLHDKYEDLKCVIFGSYDRPDYFPEWIDYIPNASQEKTIEIYNSVRVFLCSTIDEGYGLTGLESMACGCALCSSDYAAVYEYAKDGINCLLSPVGDIDSQVNNVVKVFENNEYRIALVNEALKDINDFSWEKAVGRFVEVINV